MADVRLPQPSQSWWRGEIGVETGWGPLECYSRRFRALNKAAALKVSDTGAEHN